MATQTLAAADAILKDLYRGPIVEQLNYKTYLIDQIERDSDHLEANGRRMVFPVHSSKNRGRGARGEGGTLPGAQPGAWQDAVFYPTYQYAGIEVTDVAIKQSKSNEGAFISLLDTEMKDATNILRKDLNRQAYGTGDGKLATLTAETASGKTLTVDSVQYLQVGDPVDLIKTADGTTGNGVVSTTIAKRIPSESKVELATAVTGAVTTAYGLYLAGDRSNETNGLRQIIAKNREFGKINSETAGNEFWNGVELQAGTSETSTAVAGESMFEQLADNVGSGGNGEVEAFLTTRGIRRRLADTYQSQKRYNDAKAVEIQGGYTAIFVNTIPVVADDDCPKHWAFGLNKDSFKWGEVDSPDWLGAPDGGGGVFHLKDGATAGTKMPVWQAWFAWYCNLINVAPNRNGAIRFATDDAPA